MSGVMCPRHYLEFQVVTKNKVRPETPLFEMPKPQEKFYHGPMDSLSL